MGSRAAKRFVPSGRGIVLGALLPIIGGVLGALAFAPTGFSATVLVSGTIALFCVRRLHPAAAALAAYLYGTAFAVGVASWVYVAMHEHYGFGVLPSALFVVFIVGLGVSLFIGTPIALWRLGVGRFDEPDPEWMRGRGPMVRPLLAASLFFLFEWLRSIGPFSMPWGLFGAGLTGFELVSQSAELIGTLGLSFVAMLVSALLYEALERLPARDWPALGRALAPWLSAVLAVLVLLAAYGIWALLRTERQVAAIDSEPVKVALVQANIPQGERWRAELVERNMSAYIALSEQAIELNPGLDLVVWPETAINTYITGEDNVYARRIHLLAYTNDVHFLIGGPHMVSDPETGQATYYNSLFHVEPVRGLTDDRYDKIQLLVFSEYNPISHVPLLPRPAEVPRDYSPGAAPHVFEIAGAHPGALICFEVLYPWLGRSNVLAGADLLLNVSNDAWFGKTRAPYQHVNQARLRAIELRRYLIRNAGTGISTFIDPLGHFTGERLDIFTRGIAVGEVYPLTIRTPYLIVGDWPLFFFSLGIVLLAAVAAVQSLRKRNTAASAGG